MSASAPTQRTRRARWMLLARLQAALETPMLVLALAWLALFVVEAVRGLGPLLTVLGHVIWAVFVLEFALGFALAPGKRVFLRHNWLKGIALLAPALRVLRAVRVLRLSRAASVVRGTRLLRIVSSLNRGMRALGRSMGRRGMGYVVALTVLVTVAGAAGMYAFESEDGRQGFADYGDALWWTAMLMTTMGSAYWPEPPAGRVLCLLLSLYAFGVFGYVTAAIASFFVGRDAEAGAGEVAGQASVDALRREIEALRKAIEAARPDG